MSDSLDNFFIQRSMGLEEFNNITEYHKNVQSIGKKSLKHDDNYETSFCLQLVGYSLGDSYSFHKASQFNLAEIGAVSSDMLFMVRILMKLFKLRYFHWSGITAKTNLIFTRQSH